MLQVMERPSCAGPTSAHDEELAEPLPQTHLTAERLCVYLRGEASDKDPPPPWFLLGSRQRCGESCIASPLVVGDHPINFGLGPEAMDLNGIRSTCIRYLYR